jgi:hypothetical protein
LPGHGAAPIIEDGHHHVVEKNGDRKTVGSGGRRSEKWGPNAKKISYQTKAPLVRRTLKCERRGLKRQDK